jgi:dephospho-CoA kinase
VTATSTAQRWERSSSPTTTPVAASTPSSIRPWRQSRPALRRGLRRRSRAVVVYDVPLLVEARADDPWDLIVVAHAPASLREERLISLRGLTTDEARARLASQVDDDARLAIADVVIDTAGSLAETCAGRGPVEAPARARAEARSRERCGGDGRP